MVRCNLLCVSVVFWLINHGSTYWYQSIKAAFIEKAREQPPPSWLHVCQECVVVRKHMLILLLTSLRTFAGAEMTETYVKMCGKICGSSSKSRKQDSWWPTDTTAMEPTDKMSGSHEDGSAAMDQRMRAIEAKIDALTKLVHTLIDNASDTNAPSQSRTECLRASCPCIDCPCWSRYR